MKIIELVNGGKIPALGFGVHHLDNGKFLTEVVENAIMNGYRFFETASSWGMEPGLGIALNKAIEKKNIKREDIIISTKLHDEMQGYEFTKKSFNESLKRFKTDYIDIYQIRHPYFCDEDWQTPLIDSWCAIEDLYKEGKIRAIGVANFAIKHLDFLLSEANIKPVMNQIELHPKYQQKEIEEFCVKNGILVQTWASLQYGKICDDERIIKIANEYEKTPAQIILRWHLQNNRIVMTRSTKPERQKENINIFNFELDNKTMEIINSLDGEANAIWPVGGINKGLYTRRRMYA